MAKITKNERIQTMEMFLSVLAQSKERKVDFSDIPKVYLECMERFCAEREEIEISRTHYMAIRDAIESYSVELRKVSHDDLADNMKQVGLEWITNYQQAQERDEG